VNYEKYRNLRNAQERREYQRKWMQKKRSCATAYSSADEIDVADMLTGVDTTSTDVDTRRPPLTQEEAEAEEEGEEEREETSKEEVPRPALAPLASAGNSTLPKSSSSSAISSSIPSASATSSSAESPTSSAKGFQSAGKRAPRPSSKRKKSAEAFVEGDPALGLADYFIAALASREPMLVPPDRQKWAADCAKLLAKAVSVGMNADVLKDVIHDAIEQDGRGRNGTRYYSSPSAFLGEWSNGTDKLNAAVLNWRSRSKRAFNMQPSELTGRDFDSSARSKNWTN
jgi:hypothetical protein